jgi:predicted aldo/keto reductase-like oxidoreductase
VWDAANDRRSPADRGLQWVWNHAEVAVALSGMNTLQQVQENLASADRSAAGSFSAQDVALYQRVVEAYRAAYPVPCTACGYCMPCPNGVDIPRVFGVYNESAYYADLGVPKYAYSKLPEAARADKCVSCEECVPKCPQKIGIPKALADAHAKLKY